jgi:hypothetical protein
MGKRVLDTTAPNPNWRQALPAGEYTSPPLPLDTQAALEMVEAHEQLQMTRVLDDAGVLAADDRRTSLATVSGKVGKAIAMLTGGALAAGAISAGMLATGAGISSAQAAMEPKGKTWTSAPASAPAIHDVEPDPAPGAATGVVSPVVTVTVASRTVRVRIPVTTRSTLGGLHCASVWGPGEDGRSWVADGCSALASFPITVTLDARYLPLGRSYVSITDDANPSATYPQTVALQTKLVSRFGVGIWADRGNGTVAATIPVQNYSPAAGTWIPTNGAPVQVQRWIGGAIGGAWVTVAHGLTHRNGIAYIAVPTGAGLIKLHAVRPATSTYTGHVGSDRYVTATNSGRYDYR